MGADMCAGVREGSASLIAAMFSVKEKSAESETRWMGRWDLKGENKINRGRNIKYGTQ